MNTPDPVSESHFHSFADGSIGAAPTLELAIRSTRHELPGLYDQLWSSVFQHGNLCADAYSTMLICHDNHGETDFEPFSDVALATAWQAFRTAATFALRVRPVTLLLVGRKEDSDRVPFANTLRITHGSNFFPDDPAVVLFSLTTTHPEAWERLKRFRDALLPIVAEAFCWATLGYGFVVDFDRLFDASEHMEHLCMRYLGVDLQDAFGGDTSAAPWGMRTVNWQVCASPKWLEQRIPGHAERLVRDGQPHLGSVLWQTGPAPSLCDRNNEKDHPALIEYADLDRLLRPVLFIPPVPWFPRWLYSTTERWMQRWQEVQINSVSQ